MTTVKTIVTIETSVDNVVVSRNTVGGEQPTVTNPLTPAQERAVQLKLRQAYRRIVGENEFNRTGSAFQASKAYRLHDAVASWNEAVSLKGQNGLDERKTVIAVLNEDASDDERFTESEIGDFRMAAFVNLFIQHYVVALRPYSEENGQSETPKERDGTQGW